MGQLNELGIKFCTDKSTHRHCYLDFYELLFARVTRHLYINLLEIGIQFECSIKMWAEYYPYASITGIDVADNHAERCQRTIIGNAYSAEVVAQLERNYFHIIIEDGSHNPDDQVFAVTYYPGLLKDNGIMVIEDVDSNETVIKLAAAVPDGYHHAAVDLRTVTLGVPDNLLFLLWRKT